MCFKFRGGKFENIFEKVIKIGICLIIFKNKKIYVFFFNLFFVNLYVLKLFFCFKMCVILVSDVYVVIIFNILCKLSFVIVLIFVEVYFNI